MSENRAPDDMTDDMTDSMTGSMTDSMTDSLPDEVKSRPTPDLPAPAVSEADAASLDDTDSDEMASAYTDAERESDVADVERDAGIEARETLSAADMNAEADLARPSRLTQYRAQRRTQLSAAVVALLMIAVGLFYLAETLTPDAQEYPYALELLIGAAAVGIGLFARFLLNGRRERGLSVLGLTILGWTGLLVLIVNGSLLPDQAWPLGIAAVGIALLATFLFERSHERGLILPALALIVAGGTATVLSTSAIPADLLSVLGLFWPLGLIVLALILLPRAAKARE